MTDSMVERVARAMFDDERPDDSYEKFVANNPDPQKYVRMARAAIEAMREPTDAMAQAVGSHWGSQLDYLWKQMIDEALR
jgi:hypothetical protein